MAHRVYGPQVVALGWILDFQGFRVQDNLLTSWALAAGFPDARSSRESALRLRRRATGGKRLAETVERLVERPIEDLQVDDAVLDWVAGDRARRLHALVAYTRPLPWTLSELKASYAHLEDAATGTIPLSLRWEPAVPLAQGVGVAKISAGTLAALRETELTSWDIVSELAATCGVYSDSPYTTAAAAFAAVAAGMAHSAISAVATTSLLVCSYTSEEFARLPFKKLEYESDGVGSLARWAAEYYIRCEIQTSFGVTVPGSLVAAGLDKWDTPTVEALVVDLARTCEPHSVDRKLLSDGLPAWLRLATGNEGNSTA